MAEYEKKVRKILENNNCYFKRHGKGDHDIWFSPITKLPITVDNKITSLISSKVCSSVPVVQVPSRQYIRSRV